MSAILTALAIWLTLTQAGAADRDRPAPTFRDVAPILAAHCVQCHQPGGPAPFSLISYSAARPHARQIADAVSARVMPPWKTDPHDGPFVGQTWPSTIETATLRQWADSGAPEGARLDTPLPTTSAPGWRLGRPDLVVTLPEPYTLRADGTDVFRIFVVHVPTEAARFVRGLEFQPGNARVVHHANIRIDRTSGSRDMDAADPEPGYDGLLARSALFPDGHFLGWTPGQVAPLLPKGLAWRLDPGSDLVLQVHMQPDGKPELVRPSIGFYFGVDPPSRPPVMIRLGRQNIDIAPGDASYSVVDAYTLPVDVDVQAVQPHAHYRARDVLGTATLPDGSTRTLLHIADWDFRWQHLYRFVQPFTLPAGTVLRMRYTYDNSPANPRNPQQPPVRALWGQRSSEEMGDLWIQVLARTDGDWLTLNRGFRPKAVAEDLIGYESLLARTPSDAALHDDAAVLAMELGRLDAAVGHFSAAAALKPQSATSHFNLGTALMVAGRTDAAADEFRRALAVDPKYANAHNNLGTIAEAGGRLSEALDHYRHAIDAQPGHAQALNNLGSVLIKLGRPAEAIVPLRAAVASRADYANAWNNLGTALEAAHQTTEAARTYRRALQADPRHLEARNNLGRLLASQGAIDEALGELAEVLRLDPSYADAHYNVGVAQRQRRNWRASIAAFERAAELKPGWAPGLLDLAWMLATHPDAHERPAELAVALARRALALLGENDPTAFDVLGVALAAAGRFDEAVAAASRALTLETRSDVAPAIRARIELFRHGSTFR